MVRTAAHCMSALSPIQGKKRKGNGAIPCAKMLFAPRRSGFASFFFYALSFLSSLAPGRAQTDKTKERTRVVIGAPSKTNVGPSEKIHSLCNCLCVHAHTKKTRQTDTDARETRSTQILLCAKAKRGLPNTNIFDVLKRPTTATFFSL